MAAIKDYLTDAEKGILSGASLNQENDRLIKTLAYQYGELEAYKRVLEIPEKFIGEIHDEI